MTRERDHLAGNILFYEYLRQKRAPTFLLRNRTRALHVQQHLDDHGAIVGFPGRDYELRQFWQKKENYLSKDELDSMIHQQNRSSSILLRVCEIRQRQGISERCQRPRGKGTLLRAEAAVQVAFGSLDLGACRSTLSVVHNDHGIASQIDTSFKISSKTNSFDLAALLSNQNMNMTLHITLDAKEELNELISILAPSYNDASSSTSNVLEATWKNVSIAQSETLYLPLTRDGTDLGIDITVMVLEHWSRTQERSALTQHNQSRRQPQAGQAAIRERCSYRVHYVYAQEEIVTDGLICPMLDCRSRSFEGLKQLEKHLDYDHEYLGYRLCGVSATENGGTCYRFESPRPDHLFDQRGRSGPLDPNVINQVTPGKRPVDRFEEAGDEQRNYKRSRLRRKSTKPGIRYRIFSPLPRNLPAQVQPRPIELKPKFPVPQAPTGIVFVRSCSRRPLETGEYISESDDDPDETWLDQRIAAEFDKDEWIPRKSKELLKILDPFMRREHLVSDIWVGDAIIRFTQERCAWLWEESLVQEFKNKLDELVEDEIISAEIHAGALRTLHENKCAPYNVSIVEMSARLAELEVASANNIDLYENPIVPQTEFIPKSLRPSRRPKLKGKAKLTETGNLTPVTTDSDGDVQMREDALNHATRLTKTTESSGSLPYDLCLCGTDAQISHQQSQLVACNSMNCIRRQFHYDCLIRHWHITNTLSDARKRSWICKDCRNLASHVP